MQACSLGGSASMKRELTKFAWCDIVTCAMNELADLGDGDELDFGEGRCALGSRDRAGWCWYLHVETAESSAH
jgi:hypothetical protein